MTDCIPGGLSLGWWLVIAIVTLALAGVSLKNFAELEPSKKPWRFFVLLGCVGLSVALVGTFAGWSLWAPGVVLGLAVVELGVPALGAIGAVFRAVGALARRKGDEL